MRLKNIVLSFGIIVIAIGVVIYHHFWSMVMTGRQEHWAAISSKESLVDFAVVIKKYAEDHNGILPSAETWCDVLLSYEPNLSKDIFVNQSSPKAACGFAFNKYIGGHDLNSLDVNVVLVIEASGPWNLSGGEELLDRNVLGRKWFIGMIFSDGVFGEYFFSMKGASCRGYGVRIPIWDIKEHKANQ